MQSVWLKSCKTKEDKEARIKQVKGFKRAFEEAKEILSEDFKKKDSVRDYSPGWEYKQIAVNEYNAALNDLIKLLTIED